MKRFILSALLLGATPVMAEDVALIVSNDDYDNAWGLWGADDILDTADAFEAAGFRVFLGENLEAGPMQSLTADFAARADGSGRIVIALVGHFVQSSSGAWFLGTDTNKPNLISASAEGLTLATLYEIAARAPGRSAVLLGTEDRTISLDASLASGMGTLPAPQGVAVVKGEADEIADFAEDLLIPGRSLAETVQRHSRLKAEGFLTGTWPFVEDTPVEAPTPSTPSGERAAWASALATNTAAAYEAFLRDYPNSTNAPMARAAIERMRDPADIAKADEEALRLTRDQRREVQRDLSILDYDTRGIDGILGPASRRAITSWQETNGLEPTGFLTREAIERIDAQAARRAAELEAEAAARQAEQERLDRAYWGETGAKGDEAGLRAYLRRYPDGVFAEIAQDRLRPFDEEREAAAAAADRAAWEQAAARDDVTAYREYLAAQPNGAFRAQAEARIGDLTRETQNEGAARAEAALGLNGFTRNLVEARLQSLGLRPGRVDGSFDDDTRRAIRRYQTARNLPATGYLSQQTIVRLLADSVRIQQ